MRATGETHRPWPKRSAFWRKIIYLLLRYFKVLTSWMPIKLSCAVHGNSFKSNYILHFTSVIVHNNNSARQPLSPFPRKRMLQHKFYHLTYEMWMNDIKGSGFEACRAFVVVYLSAAIFTQLTFIVTEKESELYNFLLYHVTRLLITCSDILRPKFHQISKI